MADEKITRAIEICKDYGVTKLILFGSAVNDLKTARDLDLAVDGINGWKLIELAAELENDLLINVDVVPIKGNDSFINHILPRSKVLYA